MKNSRTLDLSLVIACMISFTSPAHGFLEGIHVPDGGSSVGLLGVALLGLWAAKRLFNRSK